MTRQCQVALGGKKFLNQAVGRREEDSGFHQAVHGSFVTFTPLNEAPLGLHLLPQGQGHPVVLEGLPGLARGELGSLMAGGGGSASSSSTSRASPWPGETDTDRAPMVGLLAELRHHTGVHDPRHSQIDPKQAVIDFQVRQSGQGQRRRLRFPAARVVSSSNRALSL